jgi:hypothetical protein
MIVVRHLGWVMLVDLTFICSAYPPSDESIFDFFKILDKDDVLALKFTAFFVVLFDIAVAELDNALNTVTAGSIPERWREYLAMGSTDSSVGNNRKEFYEKVTIMANKVCSFLT